MKHIKVFCLALAGLLLLSGAACAKPTPAVQATPAPEQSRQTTAAPVSATPEIVSVPQEASVEAEPVPTEAPAATSEPVPQKSVLVVVFSATGTTKDVAEKIAAIEDADLYEIIPTEPYSSADLNWNDRSSRTTKEQIDSSVRPAIGSAAIDLSGYTRIYVGYPIWWGEEPRIMDTFVESYDFGTSVVIPFCTSASSGIGRSGKNLAENAKSGTWLDGRRFGATVSENDLASWISGLR